MAEKEIGKITHYFDKIMVAILELTKGGVKKGDVLHIVGHSTDFMQNINSMQIDRKEIPEAKKGQKVGMKADEPMKEGDIVFKVTE